MPVSARSGSRPAPEASHVRRGTGLLGRLLAAFAAFASCFASRLLALCSSRLARRRRRLLALGLGPLLLLGLRLLLRLALGLLRVALARRRLRGCAGGGCGAGWAARTRAPEASAPRRRGRALRLGVGIGRLTASAVLSSPASRPSWPPSVPASRPWPPRACAASRRPRPASPQPSPGAFAPGRSRLGSSGAAVPAVAGSRGADRLGRWGRRAAWWRAAAGAGAGRRSVLGPGSRGRRDTGRPGRLRRLGRPAAPAAAAAGPPPPRVAGRLLCPPYYASA